MIDYTKKNLTTEKIASNIISDTIRLYEWKWNKKLFEKLK
jgi:hypothetical protein